jgi:hypothetical protein
MNYSNTSTDLEEFENLSQDDSGKVEIYNGKMPIERYNYQVRENEENEYGNGYGNKYGFGNGRESEVGDGLKSGNGFGDGSGFGEGAGFGYGDGLGYGNGFGDGVDVSGTTFGGCGLWK